MYAATGGGVRPKVSVLCSQSHVMILTSCSGCYARRRKPISTLRLIYPALLVLLVRSHISRKLGSQKRLGQLRTAFLVPQSRNATFLQRRFIVIDISSRTGIPGGR